jgi:Cu+-exporting ATPase
MMTEEIAIDPVCGMKVKVATAKNTTLHAGHTYYFCNPKCLVKFTGDPDKYLKPQPAEAVPPAPPAPPGTVFTCPMHPEVRQIGPGSCPLCGMALEPAEVTLDQGPNEELLDMTRRLWIGGALAVPVIALDMGGHFFGLHGAYTNWIELLFATPVVLWAGWPFFVRGVQSVRRRALNMFTLVALGTGTAWLYSVAATITGGAVYFESAAMIIVLTLLGQVLELRARDATSGAIRGLLGLAPPTALKVDAHGRDIEVAIDTIAVGDRLRVRPGEKVPVDGVVIEGSGSVDESTITGEPMPSAKEIAARVIGGTVNRSGSFVMTAEKVGADTMLARIVKMVSEAQRSRAPIQRLADSVAGWFVPVVLASAVLAAAAWMVWGPEPRFTHALIAAVAVLIIACPCALGLATPMSIMVGVGRGASLGILVRNAEALERLEKVDTLVIDKTGTLTVGRPEITDVTGGLETLRLAASLERGSEHPLAAAITAFTRERNIALADVSDFKNHAGRGVSGTIEDKHVLLGNARLLKDDAGNRRQARRHPHLRRSRQGDDGGGTRGAAPGRAAHRHADGRQPPHRRSRRHAARHHGVRGRGPARGQGEGRAASQGRRPHRRHGGRRHQRCAGAGLGRRRHRHGHRHRHRHRKRRHHPGEGRSPGDRTRAASLAGNHGQHPPESVLRLRLQRRRRAHCSGRPLPRPGAAAQPHGGGRGDGAQLRLGHRKCP